jgi:peptide-methionine (R)-S-oxide reductase
MKTMFYICCTLIFINSCRSQQDEKVVVDADAIKIQNPAKMSEEEWKKVLTPEQYAVLREKATEKPFSGKYYMLNEKGIYVCAACGAELFSSEDKFDAGCGWPSFSNALAEGRVIEKPDNSHGMIRTEILCANCGGHLGHVFDDGPKPTGLRYCVNSVSLEFKRENK